MQNYLPFQLTYRNCFTNNQNTTGPLLKTINTSFFVFLKIPLQLQSLNSLRLYRVFCSFRRQLSSVRISIIIHKLDKVTNIPLHTQTELTWKDKCGTKHLSILRKKHKLCGIKMKAKKLFSKSLKREIFFVNNERKILKDYLPSKMPNLTDTINSLPNISPSTNRTIH